MLQSRNRVRGRVSVSVGRERDRHHTDPRQPRRPQAKDASPSPGIAASPDDDDDILSWPLSLSPPSPSPTSFSVRRSSSRGEMGSGTAQAAFAPVASSDSTDLIDTTINTRSDDRGDQSLVSWLVPVTGTALRKNKPRSARPTQGRDDAANVPYASRDWAEFSQPRGSARAASRERGVGSGDLAAWLEPREDPRGKNKRARTADGGVHVAAAGHRSSGQSDEEGEEDERWMSGRLEGLDPGGEARAKDSWTDRDRRNLTSTDVALGAKRKGRGSRGWKTKTGGGKVFVAPARGGAALVASGQAAYRMSASGRKKRVG